MATPLIIMVVLIAVGLTGAALFGLYNLIVDVYHYVKYGDNE